MKGICMNPTYTDRIRSLALYLLLPFALAKLLWSVAFLFLEKGDIVIEKPISYGYHYAATPAYLILPEAKPASIQQIKASERITDIKLKGTYIEGEKGFVVIEESSGVVFVNKGENYKGYRLKEVYEDRAIFEKGGKNYEVLLKEEMRPSSQTGGGATSSAVSGGASAGSVRVARDELNDYIRHPNKIWKNIRIQEIRKHGRIEGFRVNYVKKNSVFDRFGLKSGDIITAIDGNEIHSLGEVMRYYNDAANLEALTLTVKRGNEIVDIDFTVD
ncbi:MAG: hypothetical protein B6D59_07645 [Campylobacteraceae bacterium 4484_4]|nr:MAG: hypothetical protein B6D59_07645 [Campylobacteraceae bacterium 4484_4]